MKRRTFSKSRFSPVARFTSETPLCTGENIYLKEGYRDLFEKGAISVVHPDLLNSADREVLRTWLREGLRSGAATFLRRFDDGTRGDWVFAIRPISPEAFALRQETPDQAGRTRQQNLEAFLSGDSIAWTAGPIAETESPQRGANLEGPLLVSGWAAAKDGIARVTITLGNNRKHFDAHLLPRPDLSSLLPSFPSADVTGFTTTIPSRPRGIPRDTTVTVEVFDHHGHSLRQRPLNILWNRVPPYREIPRERWNPAALQTLTTRMGRSSIEADRILNGSLSIRDLAVEQLAKPDLPSPAFVRNLYRTVLQRDPDAPGMDLYVSRLYRGTSRKTVIETVIDSDEFARLYLNPLHP